ncbi:hypothetical protein [Thalassoglobus polymorphus]|uniref:Uncharacterized protein n=1 Tax=Thalassoglobus polymorphus TaxID=2527994 RepID=A0A517QL63_9PLAN|nr:hypothetical protein [Thalassoglobus polymorphus]QDT32385.1 hypothetical protein Mal48_16310 [Thalassoglobus polymorphus]
MIFSFDKYDKYCSAPSNAAIQFARTLFAFMLMGVCFTSVSCGQSDNVPSPAEVFGKKTPDIPEAGEEVPETSLTPVEIEERRRIHKNVKEILWSYEATRKRHVRTEQEDAKTHMRDLKEHRDDGKYTWRRWQAYDLRYAFFLAAADAPEDLNFYDSDRRRNPEYFDKMKPFVDQNEIYVKHLDRKHYYEKMSVKLSQEAFDLIRWDASRNKYLVDKDIYDKLKSMVGEPLPEKKPSTFDSDPSSLFASENNTPKHKSKQPAWGNYLNSEKAQEFWKGQLRKIETLAKQNKIVFFTHSQYDKFR